ncbi:MAG: hypothetical protein M3N56_02640, partial [Actinomycetota bacterium]|nr:hypothetical protein [Actinomycetota bacterium]
MPAAVWSPRNGTGASAIAALAAIVGLAAGPPGVVAVQDERAGVAQLATEPPPVRERGITHRLRGRLALDRKHFVDGGNDALVDEVLLCDSKLSLNDIATGGACSPSSAASRNVHLALRRRPCSCAPDDVRPGAHWNT